jgi:hypothetical protein
MVTARVETDKASEADSSGSVQFRRLLYDGKGLLPWGRILASSGR